MDGARWAGLGALLGVVIYAVRHADATGQAPDAALSAAGRRAVEALVPVLARREIRRVVSSPHLRARETVAPFAASAGLAIAEDARLREREHGAVPEGRWAEEAEILFGDWDAEPWGGESLAAAAARGAAAIEGAADGTLFATHGLLLTLILGAYGREVSIPVWRAMPRPALFELGPGTWREIELG
ncbi:MAG: histidine phosphatase family protein [Pseudomonadota bacterium]